MNEWELDAIQTTASIVKRKCVQWLVKRPAIAFLLMLVFCIVTLPAVTVIGLIPLALVLNHIGLITSSEGVITIYSTLFKGFLLAVFLSAVITIVFLVITCASIIHSHQSFLIYKPQKKND